MCWWEVSFDCDNWLRIDGIFDNGQTKMKLNCEYYKQIHKLRTTNQDTISFTYKIIIKNKRKKIQ